MDLPARLTHRPHTAQRFLELLTEEHLTEAFAHRALLTPHRADELWHNARHARAGAQRLHRMQAHLRQATVPGWLDDKPGTVMILLTVPCLTAAVSDLPANSSAPHFCVS